MPTPVTPIWIPPEERRELIRITNSHKAEHRLVMRARALLMLVAGESSKAVAKSLGRSSRWVRKWRARYIERREKEAKKGPAVWLGDAYRCGTPETFDVEAWVDVIALVTSNPNNYGRPFTHWSCRDLVDELIESGTMANIHHSTVARILKACDIQPHRVLGWLNRKEDPEFEQRRRAVREMLIQATSGKADPERVTLSFDEKTGMQAKQRIAPDIPMESAIPTRQEYEYKRHGTLCLFGCLLVHSGEVLHRIHEQRTNPITATVLLEIFNSLIQQGFKHIDIILDQLNTHWSTDLVKGIAALLDMPIPDDKDIDNGKKRRAWLEKDDKPIVFLFTPKHASWLNPIETWFGILSRKVLRRGTFSSKQDLNDKVERFIAYFNQKLARPYNFKPIQEAA